MDPTKCDVHQLAIASIKEKFAQEPDQLTVARLSELLGQGREATYRMLEAHDIPATRLPNGRWLIYTSSVRNWLIRYHEDCLAQALAQGVTDA